MLLEHFLELPLDMEAHDLIGTTNKIATYEHRRDARPTPQLHNFSLQLLPNLKLVELINHGVCTETVQEYLNGVAHATIGFAEYHQWPLSHQIRHRRRAHGYC